MTLIIVVFPILILNLPRRSSEAPSPKLGFGAWAVGLQVYILLGLGVRIWGAPLGLAGLGFNAFGFRTWGLGFWI